MREAMRGVSAMCVLVVGLLFGSGAAVGQQSDSPSATVSTPVRVSASVSQLLSAYHGLPERDLFEAASATAREELLLVVGDESRLLAHRYRALEALGAYWPDAQVWGVYERWLRSPAEEDMLHQVMPLAARYFGDRATGLLVAHLDASDVQVRLSAVEALAMIRTPGAQGAMRARLEREQDALVRERLERGLKVIR